MSYNTNNLVKLEGLQALAQKVQSDYTPKTDFTALSTQVQALSTNNAAKLNGVSVNGAALAIAENIVNLLVAQGQTNGSIAVNGVDVAVKGLAALAYKAEVSEEELSTALKATLDAKASGSALTALTTLVGTIPETSEATTIVEYAAELVTGVIGGAPEAFDTLQEIAKWIEEDQTGSAALAASVADNAKNITAITSLVGALPEGAEATTVVGYIAEAITAIGIGDYVKKTELETTLAGYVKVEAGKGLSTEDFTTLLKEKLDGFVYASDVEVSEMLTAVFSTGTAE